MIWLLMSAYEDTEDEAADHITRNRVASCGNATQLCNLSVMHARLACPPACASSETGNHAKKQKKREREGRGGAEEGRARCLAGFYFQSRLEPASTQRNPRRWFLYITIVLRCGTSDEGMAQRHYYLLSSSHRNTYHIHPFLLLLLRCYCCSRLP